MVFFNEIVFLGFWRCFYWCLPLHPQYVWMCLRAICKLVQLATIVSCWASHVSFSNLSSFVVLHIKCLRWYSASVLILQSFSFNALNQLIMITFIARTGIFLSRETIRVSLVACFLKVVFIISVRIILFLLIRLVWQRVS